MNRHSETTRAAVKRPLLRVPPRTAQSAGAIRQPSATQDTTPVQRQHFRWRRLAYGGAALAITLVTVTVFSGLVSSVPTPDRVKTSFESQKRLFTANETPTLHFKLLNRATALGSWLRPVTYAAETPTATVSYQDGRKITTNVSVSPEADGYKVVVTPDHQMRPGKYTVTIQGDSAGQEFRSAQSFAWGVLAVNTDKATYLPGETARITMGVLSSQGHTLCDAPVLLNLVTPAGLTSQLKYHNSESCKGDSFNSEPDYWTDYTVGQPGAYKLTLRLANSDYQISDQFYVAADNVPFDIQRQGPTRIYPQEPYGMNLHIKAQRDFTGVVKEILPDKQFKILDNPMHATVAHQAKQVVLTWQVNWRAGETYELNYQFKAPPVSPAFYSVGPLEFTDENGIVAYKEARAWQLAGDAGITFVKQTQRQSGAVNADNGVAMTSTSGNLLVLFWISFSGASNHCLSSVSDSAGNTWVVPAANPNQNPPQNVISGTNSLNAMAYSINAAAITTISVTQCGGFSASMGFNLVEFSGIDNTNPVIDSKSGTQSTPSTNVTTDPITLALCDQPTTDQMLRGGNYFCADTSALAIGIIYAGQNATETVTSAGYNSLTTVQPTGTTNQARPGYLITSTSGATSLTETVTNSNTYAWSFMAFRVAAAANLEQYYFWAK
jgi:hypothetical protein